MLSKYVVEVVDFCACAMQQVPIVARCCGYRLCLVFATPPPRLRLSKLAQITHPNSLFQKSPVKKATFFTIRASSHIFIEVSVSYSCGKTPVVGNKSEHNVNAMGGTHGE